MFLLRIAALFSVAALAGCSASARSEARTGSVADLCAGADTASASTALRPDRIYSIEPLYVKRPAGKLSYERLGGVTLRVKNDGTTTPDALQRSFDCHVARGTLAERNAASTDLLLPASGQARVLVEAFPREYVVRIEGDTREAGHEIYEKAKVLAPGAVVDVDVD